MTALRNFDHADARTWREPRRAASSLYHREPASRRPPAPPTDSHAPARRPWALVRTVRRCAEVLLGLWAIVALGFCAVVAVALVR
jgi:hypothetical protein